LGVTLTRRAFLSSAALTGAAGAAAALGLRGGSSDVVEAAASTLPAPASSGIEHIVVVMMENRSFDHFLGWLPGADGKQAGLRFSDRYGQRHNTFHQTKFASCGFNDPDHSYEGGRIELNGGRCDGWLRAGENDLLSISYYEKGDLSFLGRAAADWTTCDRYFAATLAETYPNRFYQHAAQTDRLHNSTTISTLPTIWDRLEAKGRTGRYYFSDIPFLALWGTKYLSIARPFAQFLLDAKAGTLPDVSFVDPRFEDESSGSSGDDHPHADIRAGEAFLDQVYAAVTTGAKWANTLLVINYDEWGGFFDHVVPGFAPDAHVATSRRGFRVPALVISPRARRNHVDHTVYDHTSILRAIEWRWGLTPLTARDRHANNIAHALDFGSAPNLSAPSYSVAPFVSAGCSEPTSQVGEDAEWTGLRKLARAHGWELPS
jgi:phospholipase C